MVLDLKTHAKISVVVRKEGRKLVSYTLWNWKLSSNNRKLLYRFEFFTKEPGLARTLLKFPIMYQATLSLLILNSLAHLDLKKTILQNLSNEVEFAKSGKPARAWIKLNSLIEKDVIDAMYEASCAGVKIDLVVRGICGLRPGIKNLSENIRVKSIVSRFWNTQGLLVLVMVKVYLLIQMYIYPLQIG